MQLNVLITFLTKLNIVTVVKCKLACAYLTLLFNSAICLH